MCCLCFIRSDCACVSQSVVKEFGYNYDLQGVCVFLSNRLSLDFPSVIEEFVRKPRAAISAQMDAEGSAPMEANGTPTLSCVDFTKSVIGASGSLANIANNNHSKASLSISTLDEAEIQRIMNSLDLTSMMLAKPHYFTLFEDMSPFMMRVSKRLGILEGILTSFKASNYTFDKMRDFLVNKSIERKQKWIATKAEFLNILLDINTTRKVPALTVIFQFCILFYIVRNVFNLYIPFILQVVFVVKC